MWSSLLALAVVGMLNPVRLGVTLLVSSQPRPLQNLLAYWVGSLTVSIPVLVVPLVVLHYTPAFGSFAQDWAAPESSSTVRYVQIGMGVLALSTAILITVPSVRRQWQPALVPASDSVLDSDSVLYSTSLPLISPRSGRGQDALTEGGSAIRRLLRHAQTAWANGSSWVSWVIGLSMGPAPDVILFSLAIIVASGASLSTQVVAAVMYVLGVLAIVEIILVTHLAAPAKAQAALVRLHDWAAAHRRQLLVAILTVVGLSMVAHGVGIV
jgi:hypothetical protein